MVIFSIFCLVRLGVRDIELIGLTPEMCTGEVTGYVVDVVRETKMKYGGTHHSQYKNYYDVNYDVIEYEVEGKK